MLSEGALCAGLANRALRLIIRKISSIGTTEDCRGGNIGEYGSKCSFGYVLPWPRRVVPAMPCWSLRTMLTLPGQRLPEAASLGSQWEFTPEITAIHAPQKPAVTGLAH